MSMNKQTVVSVAVTLAFLVSAAPALAAEKSKTPEPRETEKSEVHGYGGHDDCRDGTLVVKNGKVVCQEHGERGDNGQHKSDDKGKGNPGGSNSGSSSSNSQGSRDNLVNQIIAFFNKILGRRA
jgi:hypothetical protein